MIDISLTLENLLSSLIWLLAVLRPRLQFLPTICQFAFPGEREIEVEVEGRGRGREKLRFTKMETGDFII